MSVNIIKSLQYSLCACFDWTLCTHISTRNVGLVAIVHKGASNLDVMNMLVEFESE